MQEAANEPEGGRRARKGADGASRCLDYQNPAPRTHVAAAMHKQARPANAASPVGPLSALQSPACCAAVTREPGGFLYELQEAGECDRCR